MSQLLFFMGMLVWRTVLYDVAGEEARRVQEENTSRNKELPLAPWKPKETWPSRLGFGRTED